MSESARQFNVPSYDVLLEGDQTFLDVTVSMADRAEYEAARSRHKWPVEGYSNHQVMFWCWRSLVRRGQIGLTWEQFVVQVVAIEQAASKVSEGPTQPAPSDAG